MVEQSQVIVVSGVMASGKTTLVRAIAKKMRSVKVISFDDYSIDALPSAPAIDVPIEVAVNQYDISQLMKDFLKVRHQVETIIIDFPFGYKHQDLKADIDLAVYVKTPLDICFARQLVRDYQNRSAAEILAWAQTYLASARPIFTAYERFISSDVDLVIDGVLPLETQVAQVLTVIKKSHPEA